MIKVSIHHSRRADGLVDIDTPGGQRFTR